MDDGQADILSDEVGLRGPHRASSAQAQREHGSRSHDRQTLHRAAS
jgi:hypothetical protein